LRKRSTDFLSIYNPLVRAARARFGWFPMPTFDFDVWLSGLLPLVVLPLILSGDFPLPRRRNPLN